MTPMHRTSYHICKQEKRRQERWSLWTAIAFMFAVSLFSWLLFYWGVVAAAGAA